MSGAPHKTLPSRGGIGLKPQHFGDLIAARARGAGPHWVEVHPQNYMMAGGAMHRWLGAVRDVVPLSFHSVGLSLGDPDGVDRDELERLAALVERYAPAMVSDHLAWSSLGGESIPDLLELPLDARTLEHVAGSVGRVQDRLKRPILIENPSRMVAFADDTFDEPDFLGELCARSGCGLLLDINNVIVSSINLGFDPAAWLDRLNPAPVGEIHIAGHALEDHGDGFLVAIDDHGSAVGDQCWALLERFIARAGPRPVLVERDNDVPAFAELAAEAARADDMLCGALTRAA